MAEERNQRLSMHRRRDAACQQQGQLKPESHDHWPENYITLCVTYTCAIHVPPKIHHNSTAIAQAPPPTSY